MLLAAPPNLVVVSLDTTRADALSCYGSPSVPVHDSRPDLPRTPNLDRLADEGVRFARFYAQSPSTLASHTTLFTGLDPHGTAVVRNGFPVDAAHVTLAERLQRAGYDTRAVLGAAALEGGTGIEQGFAVWDDEAPTLRGLMFQSRADEVVRRTLHTVDERVQDAPLFLFVHFFDAHTPYDAPEPYRKRFQQPGYTGPFEHPDAKIRRVGRSLMAGDAREEDVRAVNGRYYAGVTWLDAQVGVLLEGLEERGVLDDAVVVVVADHGEVLSERPTFAYSHGSDVSDGVLHVPLLMRAYGEVPLARRAVVEREARMQDLAPTLEQILGLDVTLGTSMWDFVRPGPVDDRDGWPERPTRVVFQEATRPRNREATERWNNLPFARAVRVAPHRVEAFPVRGEAPHITHGRAGMLGVLQTMLEHWDASAPAHRTAEMADHQVRALKALGYLTDD